jgi:tripeptide aminopeptidase
LVDTRLLSSLFNIPSISGKEEAIIDYISSYLNNMGVSFKTDEYGNVFGINHKNAPLLSAHTDTVQKECDADLTKFIKIRGDILSGYGVIGGDDKCGLYIILKLLEEGEKINFVFPSMEEVGGVGSDHFVKKNYNLIENLPYCLVLDRRGSSDIISKKNGYCEEDFSQILNAIGKEFNYKENAGTFSDADNISDVLACANLSVGYYNPHSSYEYVNLVDLKNSMDFTHSIVKNVKEKFKTPTNKSRLSHYPSIYSDIPSEISHEISYEKDVWDDPYDSIFLECDSCGLYREKHETREIKSINKVLCRECYLNLIEELLD